TEQGASTTPFTKGVAVGSGVSGDLIKTPLALDPTSKYVKFFCDAASCNASYMNSLKDSISGSVPGNVMSTADTISGIGSGQDFLDNWLDPYKNEMLAYASFCPDAITQHLSRKLEIQCSYLGCLETDVKQSGAPPGVCQRTKQFSECVYSNQQMFSLIPFANVIKDATKLASNIISDPIQMGLTAGALACTEGVGGAIFGIEPGSWFHGACNTYAGVTTAFNYYNSAMNMVGKFKNVLGSETNSCPASQKLNVRRSQKEIGTYPEPLTPDKDYLERTGLSCYSSHCTKMEGNKELIYTFSKNDNGESVINIYSRQKDQESMKYLGSTEDIQIPKYTKNNIDAKGNINDKEIVTVADLKAQGLDESINNADIEGKKTNNKAETTVDESYWVAADNQDVEDILNSARFSDSNNDPNNPISQEIQTKSNAVFESYNNYKKQINNYDTELDKLNLDETIIKTGAFKSYNEQLITDLELPAIGDLTKSEIIEQLNLEEGKFISGTELKVRLKAIQAKNSKGDLNSKIKDLDDVYKKEITEYTYQQYFGSLENAMRTIHGISNGASVMTNLIFRNKDIAFGKDTILGSFSQTLNKASNFEEILCEEKLQTDVSLAGQAVIDRTENGNFRNGAFISGRRTGLIETENTTYYDYYFQAKIQTKKPTKVQIILKGSSQLDITKEISNTNQILVQPEIPITLSNGKYHIYTSKEKYDSVCLKFNTKIKNIYDQTSIDGDEICSTIIKEEK
ncbi:hypothetical protein K9K83_05520, partial [Candidatus Woesearchaeota archaeon]|nr:hypothetical protein [Candidatus Woesearchaeota archaeon]